MANQNVTQLPAQTGSANTTSLLYAVTGGNTDTSLPLTVLFNAPTITNPTFNTLVEIEGLQDLEDIGRNGNSNTPSVNINISESLNYTASYVTHYGMLLNAVQLTGGTGDRVGLGVVQTTNATLSGKSCVGITGLAVASGTAVGNYTGMNPKALVPSGLVGPVGAAVGMEADVETHSAVLIKNGLRVSDENLSGGTTTHGSVEDCAIAIVNDSQNALQGFSVGIQFGEYNQGYPLSWPVLTAGTLIQAANPNVSLAYGFDLSGSTGGFSKQAFALPQNTAGGGIQWGTAGTAGLISSTATTAGNTVQFTNSGLNINKGASGVNATFNSTSTNTVQGVQIIDTTTLAQSQLLISATSNSGDGAGIKLLGDGGTTPSKTLRATGGVFEIVNDGYSSVLLTIADNGNAAITGNLSVTGGIAGVTNASNATAGTVGEVISSSVASGSAVSLTSNTAANVTSISLTAGDWDVWGQVVFTPGGTTTQSAVAGWINTVSATPPSYSNTAAASNFLYVIIATGQGTSLPTGTARINVSSTTTVYLSALSVFGVSTQSAYGYIQARRRR